MYTDMRNSPSCTGVKTVVGAMAAVWFVRAIFPMMIGKDDAEAGPLADTPTTANATKSTRANTAKVFFMVDLWEFYDREREGIIPRGLPTHLPDYSLLDILHRQHGPIIPPVRIHAPRHDCGKGIPHLGILRHQRLHDGDIVRVGRIRIRHVRSGIFHNHIQ